MNLRHSNSLRVGVTASLSLLVCSVFAEPIDKRAPADPRGEVEIVNVAGSVRVTGWDRAEVEVRGELGRDVERLDFVSEGNRTAIRVVLPRSRGRVGGTSDLVVHIPEASALSINTVSADQSVGGVHGRQRLQAVSGSIDTKVGNEDFQVKSISGDVLVVGNGAANAQAMATVTTVSGDVTLSKISGEIDVQSVSGDMTIEAVDLKRARIRTTNGDMEITSRLLEGARFDAETINGDVRLNLLGPVDAQFDVHTFNGDIRSCFGEESVRSREHGPGRDLSFIRGQGSARVNIRTLNGGVDLCGK